MWKGRGLMLTSLGIMSDLKLVVYFFIFLLNDRLSTYSTSFFESMQGNVGKPHRLEYKRTHNLIKTM